MGLFEQFPYTNFHELNLDWIVNIVRKNEETIAQLPEYITKQIQKYIESGTGVSGTKRISDLPSKTFDAVQYLINSCQRVDFDEDFDTHDRTLIIPSNVEVFSSNNSTVHGNNVVMMSIGSLQDSGASLTFSGERTGSYTGIINSGDVYLLVDNANAISTSSTLENPYFLGGGTASLQACHYVCLSQVILHGESFEITGSPVYNSGSCKLYEWKPVTNVYIHDINLVSDYDQDGSNAVYFQYCENLRIQNVSINTIYGTCLALVACFNADVRGLKAAPYAQSAQDHDDLNTVRIIGCTHARLADSELFGSQPVDITYSGTAPYASIGCVVENCNIQSIYTGITTHPGTYGCLIKGNKITVNGDGISLRGSMHTAAFNKITYTGNSTSDYGLGVVDGCQNMVFCDNVVIGFAVGFLVHETVSNPARVWRFSGKHFINCYNNVFYGTEIPLKITTANSGVDIKDLDIMFDNEIQATGGKGNIQTLIYSAGYDNAVVKGITFIAVLKGYTMNTGAIRAINGTVDKADLSIIAAAGSTVDKGYQGTATNCSMYVLGGSDVTVTLHGTQIPVMQVLNA